MSHGAYCGLSELTYEMCAWFANIMHMYVDARNGGKNQEKRKRVKEREREEVSRRESGKETEKRERERASTRLGRKEVGKNRLNNLVFVYKRCFLEKA